MKTLNRTLSLALVFALVFSLMSFAFADTTTTTTTTTTGYTDTANITYKEAVDVTSAIGVFQGSNGAFAPKDQLTREQAAKIICYLTMGKAAADKLTTTSAPYTDVAAGRWSAGPIAYCKQQGIISGYGDGKFGPTDTVTGYQFDKMLLVALGYDQTIEQFTGSDWQINVAKRAYANSLSVGNDAFVGTAAATREEAALYVYNTLLAPTYTYSSKGTNITTGGITINTGASAPAAGVSFMKAYYPTLTVSGLSATANQTRADVLAKGHDDFGRVANVWKLGTKEIGTYPVGALVSYTTYMNSTSGKAAVAKALKGYTLGSVTPTINSANGSAVTTTDGIAALTGNGTRVDVYATGNAISSVVVVKEVLAKVTYINTKAETISLLTQVDGNYGTSAVSFTTALGYGKVAVGDYVVITTKDAGSAGVIAGDTAVVDLSPVTTVTGKATTKSNTDSTITVNSKTYEEGASVVTANNVANFAVSGTGDATLVLDQYGYIVLAKSGTAVNADKLFVLTKVYNTMTNNQIVKMVEGYNSKGDQVDMALASDDASGITTTLANAGLVYQFVASTTDSGAYKLTALSGTWATNNAYTPDNASNTATPYAFRLSAQTTTSSQKLVPVTYNTAATMNYYFASDVKFIFADSGSHKASVVSGAQTVSSSSNMTYVLRSTGTSYVVSAVIVEGPATSSANSSSDLVFLAAVDSNSVVGSNGLTYDSYTAVQNGAPIANCYGTHNALTASDCGKFYTATKDSTTGAYTFTAYADPGVTPLFVEDMAPVSATNTDGSIITTLDAVTLDISKATIINLDTKSVGSAAEIAAELTAKQAGAVTTAPYIAAIFNDKNVASVVYYTAKSMASVTANLSASTTLVANGVTVTGVTANKTYVAPGDPITYTITYTTAATVTATTTITVAAPANTSAVTPMTKSIATTDTNVTNGSFTVTVAAGAGAAAVASIAAPVITVA